MMAEAFVRGILKSELMPASSIHVYELFEPRRKALVGMELGIHVHSGPEDMIGNVDAVVLATKPDVVEPALLSCAASWREELLLVSICAGVKMETLSRIMSSSDQYRTKIVRAMPNTPSLVGEAATAFCAGSMCAEEDTELARKILSSVGKVVQLPEKLMDAVTGLSGSGPAYVYMFIEALADAGVRQGLPRQTARTLAAQTVLGAAKMVVEDPSVHTAELRNRVESPGGTTIAGTQALEEKGLRAAVSAAVSAATKRSVELGES